MTGKPRFYITTAISYTNGSPHMGHAYEAIVTDAIARFKSLDGFEVLFTTGTDEHGQKVERAAKSLSMNPADYVRGISDQFRSMAEVMGCHYHRFVRTSQQEHRDCAQAFWRRMQRNDDIYLSKYSGWYSVRNESFYNESETFLKDDGQRYVDQDTPVEWVEEESYFFRLSAYQEKLLEIYAKNPDFVRPDSRYNEVIKFVEMGLKDISVSRVGLSWGIQIPDNPRHSMYVWVDALSSYLTGCGFPDTEGKDWHYWPANLHVIGKDIIRFHAVYWPAFLLSAGLPIPESILGHGFLLHQGEKMSKSLGNVVDPVVMAERYGLDQLRYFFLREVPLGQDGNYSHHTIVQRINSDLANDLGNLVQRSLSMVSKHLRGILPVPDCFTDDDLHVMQAADALVDEIRRAMDSYAIHSALERMWLFINQLNRYFTNQEPWALRTTNPQRMQSVLYVTMEGLRQVGILLQPFLPKAAKTLLDLLSVPAEQRCFAYCGPAGRFSPAAVLPFPSPIFPRYVDEVQDAG